MNILQGWLAYPQALLLLAALPVLALVALLAWLARRRGLRQLGTTQMRMAWSTGLLGRRLWRGLLIAAGLVLVGLAAAGPQWGREHTETVGAARDLVVLLDVSRSMLAETPSRQLRAQRVLSDLAATLKQRGGHRVALVVIAARGRVVMPLTTDYDLFQTAVLEQDAARLPAELRPGREGPASGTRLGEGLRQAIAVHDPNYRGSQMLLLVSDGDDPAGDGEWQEGRVAARRAGIPVFVVGVGDPTTPSKIRIADVTLKFGDRDVETTLNEDVLQQIAKRTGGAYFPVRTDNVAPGTLFPALLEAAAALPRDTPLVEDTAKQFRWFLVPGLLCLAGSLLVRDRRLAWLPKRAEGLALAAALLAIGAQPDVENLVRQGNLAFQSKDYETALKYYEQAEQRASDPGLVAFNKGATLVRLGQFRKAELCYLRCLQDRQAPAQRRLMGLYDLGTALLQYGGDAKDLDALARAGECFEQCLKAAGSDKDWQDDAEHNMELARLLWLKVRADIKPPDDKGVGPDDPLDPRQNPQKKGKPHQSGDPTGKDRFGDKGAQGDPGDKAGADSEDKLPGTGTIQTIPDTDQLPSLDGADARELLARILERIERDRERGSAHTILDSPNVKDW